MYGSHLSHVIVFPNGTTIILRKMGPVHTIVRAKQFTHSRAPNVVLCKIWLDGDDTAFLQKLSSSSSGVPIDSPHVIVFSNGTTIILRKMGPIHTIVLAKQFTHSRAPNVVLCYKIWTAMTPPSCRNYHPRRRVSPSILRM